MRSYTFLRDIFSASTGVEPVINSVLYLWDVPSPPGIFWKVVRAVVYRARALGINVFSYLDDMLTFNLSYEVTKSKSYEFADLLTQVGFLLHKEKSVREPTQRILFLSFIIDSTTMTLEVPHEKFVAIQALIQSALEVVDRQTFTSLRFLAKFVGKLISVCFI